MNILIIKKTGEWMSEQYINQLKHNGIRDPR
jgi:hypothetical protein